MAITTVTTVSTVPSGTAIATKVRSGEQHQIVVPFEQNRTDPFTTAGNGTTVDVSVIPCSRFGIQVKGTGAAATAWVVVLEGSLDGTTFTTLLTHDTPDGDGKTVMLATAAPLKYFRSRCVSITLGSATNVVATIIGEAA